MIFKKSITAKFLAAIFVVLLLGQTIGFLMFVLYSKGALYDSLEQRMQRAAAITAGVSAGPLMSYDYAPIDAYLQEIMKDEDISAARVLDSGGKPVRESLKAAVSAGMNPFFSKKTMTVKSPVMAGASSVGEVVIEFSPLSISRSLTESILTITLYQFIMLIVTGVFMMFLFTRNIKNPVIKINKSIERITAGELATDVPNLGENEIGSIAKGVSFLAVQLSTTLSRLNSTAVNVSMAIKQVDSTYHSVTSSTTKQTGAVQDIIKSIHQANKAQSEIYDSAEKLANFSTENVSSLIELKATAEEIDSNTQRLFKATEDAYSVVAQMTHTAKEIAKNTGEALTAVENTSASVEEISASVREVEEHARESSKMAEKVRESTSDVGMLAIVDAVEGMENILTEVKKSSDIVQRLGSRSSDIEKVLSVIKDVTEQTNLLSLNAAILAAQAGEYGKSFSVVADEIRALSERTASSTREIGGIVKTIQKDIKDAVFSIESANVKVEEGNGLVLKVGDALKDILTAAQYSTEMTKAIERATEEQSLGLRQITSAIEDVRKMMNSIVKATSEQDNALSYLLEGVGEVKEVADLSKRGTEEQAAGTRGISKNLEMANDRINQINQAVLNQKKLNEEIIRAMDQINAIGNSTITEMADVTVSLGTLFSEIENMRKEMEFFKTKQ